MGRRQACCRRPSRMSRKTSLRQPVVSDATDCRIRQVEAGNRARNRGETRGCALIGLPRGSLVSEGPHSLCLEGELDTELQDGRSFRLTPGKSYQVADQAEPLRSSMTTSTATATSTSTATGAKPFFVNGSLSRGGWRGLACHRTCRPTAILREHECWIPLGRRLASRQRPRASP